MGTRGKSTASIRVLNTLPPERVKPLKHLSAKQKRIWKSIVDTMPETHFINSDFPLLEAYVLSIELMRDAYIKSQEGDPLEVSPWLKVIENQQTRIGNLAVKLRLSPNSRTLARDFKAEDKPKNSRNFA